MNNQCVNQSVNRFIRGLKVGTAMLACVATLSGCGLIQQNATTREVLSDPTLPAQTRKAIVEKKIRIGMTKKQVIAAWGSPCGYCPGTRTTSRGEWWEYNIFGTGSYGYGSGTYLLFDNRGLLTYWSN